MLIFSPFFINFLKALTLTTIIETTVLFLLTRRKDKELLIAGSSSLFTLPFAWFIFPKIFSNYTIVSEIFAILGEAPIIAISLNINIRKALIFSFLANIVSFLIGLCIAKYIF